MARNVLFSGASTKRTTRSEVKVTRCTQSKIIKSGQHPCLTMAPRDRIKIKMRDLKLFSIFTHSKRETRTILVNWSKGKVLMSREPLTVGNYFNAIALVLSYIFRKLALFKLIQTNPGLSNSSVKAVFFRRCFDSIFRTILPIKTFYCDWQVSKLLTSILFYDGCQCKFFSLFSS